jgi:hypothetical protein
MLLAEFGLTMKQFMHDQMRMNVNALIKYTPPSNAIAGKKTITADYNMLFSPMKSKSIAKWDKRFPSDRMFSVKTTGQMREYHRANQDKRGRVNKTKPITIPIKSRGKTKTLDKTKRYVTPENYRSYLKRLLLDVGKTKAGWLANPFWSIAPAFVKRQSSKWGSYVDAMGNDGSGYLEVTNSVKWVSRYERELETLVSSIRKTDLARGLRTTVEKLAKKFNASRSISA